MPIYPAKNLKNDDYQPDIGWDLVWADEFDGECLNSDYWTRQVEDAGRFNNEWQRYTDSVENAWVENGVLVLKADHVGGEHGSDQYTSARLNTARKFTFKYGKIAARMQLPYGKGVWPAFWMLGANIDENGGDTPWPHTGEIDILELFGTKSNSVVEANIHYADLDGNHAMMDPPHYQLDHGIFADNFHVFELEWSENTISWFVDGQQYASIDIDSELYCAFHHEFFLLLNIAIGGSYSGGPDDSTDFPQYMCIDWVRVYQKSGE